jgi:hypothetical protein
MSFDLDADTVDWNEVAELLEAAYPPGCETTTHREARRFVAAHRTADEASS